MLAGVPITRLVLADRVPWPGSQGGTDPLVEVVHGDLTDRVDEVFAAPVDVLFHLAAAVSAECEAERGTGAGRLDSPLPVNLPALTVSIAEVLATLRQIAGDAVADLVTIARDPVVEAMVGSWPADFDNRRAAALGLRPDPGFETVVQDYLSGPGVEPPGQSAPI